MPADAYAVVLVPTELEGEQLRRFEHLLGPWLRENGGGGLLELFGDPGDGVNAERDIRPLLGTRS